MVAQSGVHRARLCCRHAQVTAGELLSRSDSLKAPIPCLVAAYTLLASRTCRPATGLMLTRSATLGAGLGGPQQVRQRRMSEGEPAVRLRSAMRCQSSKVALSAGLSSITPRC